MIFLCPVVFLQNNPASILLQSTLHCSVHSAQQEVLKQHHELDQQTMCSVYGLHIRI